MHTRSRAAAVTALLLTASVTGLGASGGSAQATTHTTTRAVTALRVTIKSTANGPKLSSATIRRGKTLFSVVRGSVGGSMEIVRFKHGYTIADFAQDAPLLFQGDVAAVNRVDNGVEFYGGMPVAKKTDPTAVFKFGVDIDKAGTYYVINFAKSKFTTFTATGTHQTRTLPAPTGKIGMKLSHTFAAPATDPHAGWMKTTNNATQPHFVQMDQVKKTATDQQVQDWLANPTVPPPFAKAVPGGSISTEVVSPGRTVIWKYRTHAGRYLAQCYYPDNTTGMPHFFMGMFALIDLTR
jgi:hypothetical protein